ncbi:MULTISPECIES: mechanosensitive ion channel family protein [unclassified Simplicispira]|mgnify:CR=1 FL=1|jgi:small-conductance mechanosensitive channel|uniref:mechanosensitive ion channel family protein n=1 Tax=unclassified Simplicispira TaxID=2630407 RepID=UPI000D5D3BE5|nr:MULTISPECIES: mechanosensitive ion channel domain-containing protein [unclassified Simplicispira]PVY55082.1 mechanosensitive ion channel-like protein [Simplicispira sp. 125]REG16025.1 mechanosensitive ion channel-like protein [Simplicispira sp. 110]
MATRVQPLLVDGVDAWLEAFTQPSVLIELGVLALCAVLAWALVSVLRRGARTTDARSILFGRNVIDGVLFPLVLLALAYVARTLVQQWMPLAAFAVAIPVLVALVVIRMGVKVLQAAFPQAGWVRPIERSISWLAWLVMVLWVTGLLPMVLQELGEITWKVGNSTLSVRTLIEGTLTAAAVLLLSLWLSAAIEARLLRSATGGELSLRKAVSNATRALLVFVGLIVALSAVGIDLTALSVLGGAIGVGVGLGLQKLAANYVSGFVILAERSIRIGDNVRVDGFEGRVTDIKSRYTVIRSLGGRESVVPNEMITTSRVENLTLADPRVWSSTVVSVGYDSDVDLVLRLLADATLESSRVLRDPAPSVALSAFGADGLEFTVGFWIADPENGQMGLRSQVNLAILRSLRAHGIDIPFPQRVLHLTGAAPGQMPLAGSDRALAD